MYNGHPDGGNVSTGQNTHTPRWYVGRNSLQHIRALRLITDELGQAQRHDENQSKKEFLVSLGLRANGGDTSLSGPLIRGNTAQHLEMRGEYLVAYERRARPVTMA